MKIGFISLGCSKNQVDTETMMGLAVQAGYQLVNRAEDADIIIVNTCGFIEDAKREAIDTLLEMGTVKQEGRVKRLIAAGCLAQRYPRELLAEMPELDAVMGVSAISRLENVIQRCLQGERFIDADQNWPSLHTSAARIITTPPGWAYLKIADGCSNRCAYCAIPSIRGPLCSRPMDLLEQEAADLINRGVKELVLVAQDTTAYGADMAAHTDFYNLVSRLSDLEGLDWIRIMYAYPGANDEALLRALQLPKVVSYLDMPLQHGSNTVLKRMGRKYTRARAVDFIGALRAAVPDITLRTTIMTGFPGETEKQHRENLSLLKEIAFDWAGVFAYSPEEGTPAYQKWPDDIPTEIKEQRKTELMLLQQQITSGRNSVYAGQRVTVLVEQRVKPGRYVGRTAFQAPDVDGVTYVKTTKKLVPGQFVQATVIQAKDYDLIAAFEPGR